MFTAQSPVGCSSTPRVSGTGERPRERASEAARASHTCNHVVLRHPAPLTQGSFRNAGAGDGRATQGRGRRIDAAHHPFLVAGGWDRRVSHRAKPSRPSHGVQRDRARGRLDPAGSSARPPRPKDPVREVHCEQQETSSPPLTPRPCIAAARSNRAPRPRFADRAARFASMRRRLDLTRERHRRRAVRLSPGASR
jgi:hypothetical protein